MRPRLLKSFSVAVAEPGAAEERAALPAAAANSPPTGVLLPRAEETAAAVSASRGRLLWPLRLQRVQRSSEWVSECVCQY